MTKPEHQCTYPGGCPIEPLMVSLASLEEQKSKLIDRMKKPRGRIDTAIRLVTRIIRPENKRVLVIKLRDINNRIAVISDQKDNLEPCKHCLYQ